MKKFLSVALSLIMLCTITTFNGNAVERPQKREPQVVNTQARYGRNVNFKEQNQENGFEYLKAKASKALKSTGRAIAGAAKVAGEFVRENAELIVTVGLGAAVAAFTTCVVVNAYKNRTLIDEVWEDADKSIGQKITDTGKFLLKKMESKEEPGNGDKEQPSQDNTNNENGANNENPSSNDNNGNETDSSANETNKEEKINCLLHPFKCQAKIKELKNTAKITPEELKKLEEDKNAAEKEVTDLKGQVETLTTGKNAAEKEVTNLKGQVNDLTTGKNAAEKEVTNLKGQVNDLTTGKNAAEKEVTDLKGQVETLTTGKNAAEQEVTNLKSQVNDLTTGKNAAEQEVTNLKGQVNDLTTGKNAAEQEVTNLKSQVNDLTTGKNAAEQEVTNLKSQVEDLKKSLESCKKKTTASNT